jgi:hypothetical protein
MQQIDIISKPESKEKDHFGSGLYATTGEGELAALHAKMIADGPDQQVENRMKGIGFVQIIWNKGKCAGHAARKKR